MNETGINPHTDFVTITSHKGNLTVPNYQTGQQHEIRNLRNIGGVHIFNLLRFIKQLETQKSAAD